MAKKKGRGKGKGNANERAIAKRLSLWWTNNERDDVFWRTSNSGGRSTVSKAKHQYGDVGATDPIGKPLIDFFTIELKKGYNRSTIVDLVDGKKNGDYEEWFTKAFRDHKAAGSISWLLIHQRDRREPLVFLPKGDFLRLLRMDDGDDGCLIVRGIFSFLTIYVEKYERIVICMPLDLFLSKVTPEMLEDRLEIEIEERENNV